MTKDEALKQAVEAIERFGRGEGGGLPLTVLVHDLRKALAQPEQEPVAWMNKTGTDAVFREQDTSIPNWTDYYTIPLYTAPQKQPPVIDKSVARRIASQLGWEPPKTPLTDEEVNKLVDDEDWYNDPHGFARAIEAAHGIKGEA